MTTAATSRVGHKATPVPEQWRRPERNPLFRGWCYLCGTPIYPGRFNWYCRVHAQFTSAQGVWH